MKFKYMMVYVITFIIGLNVLLVRGATKVDEVRVHEYLQENYHAQVRPVLNDEDIIDVEIQVYVLRVTDLSEMNQILSSTIWISAFWRDNLLNWNESDYGDVDMVIMNKHAIWIPDILLQNEVGNKKGMRDSSKMNNPKVWSNGNVEMWTFKQVKTACIVDPTKFPFDVQYCSYIISKWYNDDSHVNLTYLNDQISVEYFEKSEEWDMRSAHVEKKHFPDSKFSYLEFTIELRRKPLFTMLNLMLPLMVLIGLNQVCFQFPIEGGEKISFAMATFLTFVVYLTLISGSLPQSSVRISILGTYVVFQLGMSAMIIFIEVIVIRIYFSKANERPSRNKKSDRDLANNQFGTTTENIMTGSNAAQEVVYETEATDRGKVHSKHNSDSEKYRFIALKLEMFFARVVPVVNLVAFIVMFVFIYT